MSAISLSDFQKAQQVLSSVLRPTPLIRSELSCGCNLYLKPENLQRTGSFKLRGAYNKIANLSEAECRRGVIACSAGNHAQGVALAARERGIRAVICMPEYAPRIKVENTKALGAEVVLVPGCYDDAYEKALQLQIERGYTFVHPFNDKDVIAGQGTIAAEILQELPETDVILCSAGGGGLLSGIAACAKQLRPGVRVYGVQASGAPSLYASFSLGYVAKLSAVRTFADGIAVKEVGNLTFELSRQYVDDILTVSDGQILKALKKLIYREKLVTEGAGATPLAAVLSGLVPGLQPSSNVVCVLSGGNIDIPLLAKIITDGLD